jgi:hypothetical protein
MTSKHSLSRRIATTTYRVPETTFPVDSVLVCSSKHFEHSQTTGFSHCYCAYSDPIGPYQTPIYHFLTVKQGSHFHNTCQYFHHRPEGSSWPIPYSQTPATGQNDGRSYSPAWEFFVSSCYWCFQKRHTRPDQPTLHRLYQQRPAVVSSARENLETQHSDVQLPVRLHPHYPAPPRFRTRGPPPGLARVYPSRWFAARRLLGVLLPPPSLRRRRKRSATPEVLVGNEYRRQRQWTVESARYAWGEVE